MKPQRSKRARKAAKTSRAMKKMGVKVATKTVRTVR